MEESDNTLSEKVGERVTCAQSETAECVTREGEGEQMRETTSERQSTATVRERERTSEPEWGRERGETNENVCER